MLNEDNPAQEVGNLPMPVAVGLWAIVHHNFRSIERYHRSVSALVAEVRAGSLDSLFKAVSIDRSALACPTIANCIARAELLKDEAFFKKLGVAIQGPSKRHQEALDDVRFVMYLLREMGLEEMADRELERLIVQELGVYKHPDPADARKALGKHFKEAKKFSTT